MVLRSNRVEPGLDQGRDRAGVVLGQGRSSVGTWQEYCWDRGGVVLGQGRSSVGTGQE